VIAAFLVEGIVPFHFPVVSGSRNRAAGVKMIAVVVVIVMIVGIIVKPRMAMGASVVVRVMVATVVVAAQAAVAMGVDKGGTKPQNRQENQPGPPGDPWSAIPCRHYFLLIIKLCSSLLNVANRRLVGQRLTNA
jgi:hypothetical protein